MYLIAADKTRITRLEEKKFSELGFKERNHLQEWLADNPQALGEDLLIIQKEFDGFNDTHERLDLLAIDKQGNLVIIENKLDDSGRDVTWQALKYASYCSSLSKGQIKNIYQDYLNKTSTGAIAEEKLAEFFEKDYEELNLNIGAGQRIMMVAGKFRKEVTSTVIWLLNYKIRLQCFKATPFALGEQWFLNIEQIIPVPDMEELTIRMAEKTQDSINSQETLKSRHHIRLDFWKEFIKANNSINSLFRNCSPSKDNWIGIGIGISGVNINTVISKSYARVEVYINRGEKEENKKVFDFYKSNQKELEAKFGEDLTWERMDDKVSCRIKYQLNEVNVFEKDDWPTMIDFLVKSVSSMETVFKPFTKKLSDFLKLQYFQ